VAIVAQVAGALDAAHADGLMHRDIKPSNVLVTGNPGREFVYLVDFGIVQSVDDGSEAPLTTTGATVGTLDYMAPERFLGTGSDHRADVYSLACLLFEALTGRKPFRGDGLPAMIHAHLNMDPPSPSRERPTVPTAFDSVIATGMSKKPADRYASAGALADAALAALDPPAAAITQTIARPPDAHQQPTARFPQRNAQVPPSHTVLGLPTAGFTAPAAAGDPSAPTPRRRGVLAAAAAVIVAVGVAVAVPLLASGTGDPGTSTAADTTTEPSTAETTTEEDASGTERPESLSEGDPDADQELWDTLQGSDALAGGCEYVEPALGTVRSSLMCNTLDPELDQGVRFDAHSSPEEVQAAIDEQASRLSGDPGFCDAGGTFTGEQSDRYMTCGILASEDETTTSMYLIGWTRPDLPILATIVDDEASAAWTWFAAHDPF